MNREDKELLFKDLSARLLYEVIVSNEDDLGRWFPLSGNMLEMMYCNEAIYKPYLRPMSSMTEDEVKELEKILDAIVVINEEYNDFFHGEGTYQWQNLYDSIDWLNAHHFDYRGLIEKGLAFEALEWMYK